MLNRNSLNILNVWLLFAIWLCSALGVFAQTMVFQLRNGDRLTGRIVSEYTNRVVISTTWAKELTIPLDEIAKREAVATVATTTNATTALTNTLAKADLSTNGANIAVPKPGEVKPKGPQHWHGEVSIGTDLGFSEKDRQLYYGKVKITYGREMAPQRFLKNTFDLSATYGRTDGITSANQANGSSKTDFDLTKRIFVYNLVGSGYDEIRKIDFQYEVGPGFGYHVLMLTNFALNSEIGMDYQAQYYKQQKILERYFYRLAEDSKWVINKKLSFDEKFEFFPVEDLRQFRLRFESNLRYTFLEKFIFTLTVLDTYDTQPANGVAPNDLQIRSSLGLKF